MDCFRGLLGLVCLEGDGVMSHIALDHSFVLRMCPFLICIQSLPDNNIRFDICYDRSVINGLEGLTYG